MIKYYLEEINEKTRANSWEEFDTLKDALNHYKADLHSLANYNYFANKDTTISLLSSENPEDDAPGYNLLSQCTVEDYKYNLNYEERENLFNIKEA